MAPPAIQPLTRQPGFEEAYRAYQRQEKISTGRVASALVVLLMPTGAVMDYFVYPEWVGQFLAMRLACSAVGALIWWFHLTPRAERHVRWISLPIAVNPAVFISWMVYVTEGPASTYYAGLCTVLVGVNALVHWSLRESVAAVAGVIAPYLAACVLRGFEGAGDLAMFVNNCYFLGVTGVIVITGNYVFNRLRFREFCLRLEVDQSRRQLEESNRKLRELDQLKSRFFANISHELRTPLTLLLAPLEAMLNRTSPMSEEERRNLLLTMQANAMRLLRLINDLLDLVRLEAGRMTVQREPVELEAFLRGLVSTARPVAQERKIQLEVRTEPGLGTALADRDKLEKVLLNLLFNALKFTPEGGRVELRGNRQDGRLLLHVSDTGVGIAPEHLPHVFDRFWQADSSARRKFQGAGIGLALVKELTEMQDGSVAVDSEPGRGTTFTVELPFLAAPKDAPSAPRPAAPTPGPTQPSDEWLAGLYRRAELFPALSAARPVFRPPPVAAGTQRPRLLVADDEPDMLAFLETQLGRDYDVLTAADGRRALERTGADRPELILLDMMMPELDGLQTCREIRRQPGGRTVPIMLLTARADEETKIAALTAGANDFLTKPFSTTELQVRIRNLILNHQLQQEVSRQNEKLKTVIEQLKETEVQLIQSEKLASLGRMSAGMIHEINNPLNFATTALYTLRSNDTHLPEEHRTEYLDIIRDVEDGLRRVQRIVTELRAFSHPGAGRVEDVRVATVVGTALRFLSAEWKDVVEVRVDIPESLVVEADSSRLVQVFVNLLQNSLDALAEKPPPSGSPTIWLDAGAVGGRAVLRVRDNGPGVDPAIAGKIFDPFFTTKEVGKGLGLGLSISHRIVSGLGGHLSVRSEPGQFTEFTLELPLRQPATTEAPR